jgi:hypothetical protein
MGYERRVIDELGVDVVHNASPQYPATTKPKKMMRCGLLLAYLLLTSPIQAFGRFNLDTCWPNLVPERCIKRNPNGRGWCFYPGGGFTIEYLNMNCSSEYNGRGVSNFRLAMRTHLQQTISIGYYLGTELLGGTDWPVPENPGNVRLCMTGLGTDGIYRSTCVNPIADNMLQSGTPTCTVNYAQQFLTDGCCPPPPTVDSVSPNGTTSDDLIQANGASERGDWVWVSSTSAVLAMVLSDLAFLASYLLYR